MDRGTEVLSAAIMALDPEAGWTKEAADEQAEMYVRGIRDVRISDTVFRAVDMMREIAKND